MYRATVTKIAELASEFSVRVIAEGIEDKKTAAICLDAGIRYMQGYFFARPAANMLGCNRDLLNLAEQINQYASESEKVTEPRPTEAVL